MDKVNVTDMSLWSCRRALDKFGSELLTASEKYAAALTECVSGVDSELKNKLNRYIDLIRKMNQAMQLCLGSNINAIDERIAQIHNYENCAYIKRDIL